MIASHSSSNLPAPEPYDALPRTSSILGSTGPISTYGDGGWTERVSTNYPCGGFLALSPDGDYLFGLQEGVLWVDTSFIEELRPGS